MPIDIRDKKDCVGCNACVQRCPKQCIAMNPDEQGFIYPKVNLSLCIDCGLCERVCPVINRGEESEPLKALAACNRDVSVMESSSSGGVFHALASKTIEEGGMVFGARFDSDWNVRHDYTETSEGITRFQKSKYLQSRIGDSFLKAEKFLKEGRKVMFTGTPCQIAALRLFLRKDYSDQLLLVDVACHGVPSPMVWQDYLRAVARQEAFPVDANCNGASESESRNSILSVCFRDRRNGWADYGLAVTLESMKTGQHKELFQPQRENLYMKGFLRDLTIRPSCFACPAKAGRSGSDLTLADFWGIQKEYPELYREGKYSLVLVRSEKGCKALTQLRDISSTDIDAEVAVRHNPALVRSAHEPKIYREFWKRYSTEGLSAIEWGVRKLKPSLARRMLRLGKKTLRNILHR